jgi:GAF domain-containing protein
MILDRTREELELARKRLKAASCTMYVRDPFWPDELRLIAMPGVKLNEPMHGFSFPPHSKRVLIEGEPEIFSADSSTTKQLREVTESPLNLIDRKKRFLFGDFIEREGVKSSARLWHVKDGRIEAILFVNFAKTRKFNESLVQSLRDLRDKLIVNLDELVNELRASETDALVQAIRMFPPTHSAPEARLNEWDQPLVEYLRSLLSLALSALGLDLNTTFGTVHLYDRQTKTLGLAAYLGKIDALDRAKAPLSVPKGEGIISWVAIRRKALLVDDIKKSQFKKIHIPLSTKVRSEIAIPIFAGEELVGVLNLESFLPNAFRPTCVRSLWFAVNRAAVAYRLRQQADVNVRLKNLSEGLLELCGKVVDKGVDDLSLDGLAELAATELQAARCGIWHYDAHNGKFALSGISSPDFKPEAPRANGWSSFIRRQGWSVWISGASGIYYRDGTDWVQPSTDQKPPDRTNPSVTPSVRSLLGIPIKVRGQFTGIAWLEYEIDPETPLEELLKLASGFAAYAGLAIEFSQFDLVEKAAVQNIGEKLFNNLLASGPLKLEGFPRIEGYVKSYPFPRSLIGGDFYAAKVIDEQTVGVLVGDGEGHAVQGALNMLPMLTVFEAFWKESRSATHIMDKIMGISNMLGVTGSAIYCVFTIIEKRLWLSVTHAAHPYFVIFPKDGGAEQFPKKDSPAWGPMIGVPLLKSPLGEEHRELFKDDLIIIYTDGLDLEFNEVGTVGLRHTKEDLGMIAEAVVQEAAEKRKREGKPVDDDQTVLVIRIK